MAEERVPTEIKGFDDLIEGGLPKGSLTLVSGTPGTGKSIFCMQALYNNAMNGRNCLYLTFEQSVDDVKKQMTKFNWNWDKLDGNLKVVCSEVDDPSVLEKIDADIKQGKYALIAIDSLASLASAPIPPQQIGVYTLEKIASSIVPAMQEEEALIRQKIKMIIGYLRRTGVTALLTSEISKEAEWLSRDTISEFLCDGVILLKGLAIGKTFNRTMQIAKMRYVEADCTIKSFSINRKDGIILD